MDQIDEDICWNIIGDKCVKGKKNFEKALSEMAQSKVKTLNIHHIITHRKTGSVNGEMIMDSGKVYAFCDVCVFTHTGKSAKIKEFNSYCLKI